MLSGSGVKLGRANCTGGCPSPAPTVTASDAPAAPAHTTTGSLPGGLVATIADTGEPTEKAKVHGEVSVPTLITGGTVMLPTPTGTPMVNSPPTVGDPCTRTQTSSSLAVRCHTDTHSWVVATVASR